MKEEKRYVVQVDMYVYAKDDYSAKKQADDIRKKLDKTKGVQHAKVTEIGEQRFASLDYRKLDEPVHYDLPGFEETMENLNKICVEYKNNQPK